jgi:hypothetical protein
MLSPWALRRVCNRVRAQLSGYPLDRHRLLDAATALTLVTDSLDRSEGDDVVGHDFAALTVERQLNWLRRHGHTAPVVELRERLDVACRAVTERLAELE